MARHAAVAVLQDRDHQSTVDTTTQGLTSKNALPHKTLLYVPVSRPAYVRRSQIVPAARQDCADIYITRHAKQAALTANVTALYQALHFQHRSCALASCYSHWDNHVPQCV